MATKTTIVQAIEAHREKRGGAYSDWYIGIAADAKKRLEQHNALKSAWIHDVADTETVAREVEKYFLDLGMDGGTGGGSSASRAVYAYLKQSYTDESA